MACRCLEGTLLEVYTNMKLNTFCFVSLGVRVCLGGECVRY